MRNDLIPPRPADQHRLMERMAHANVSDDEAFDIIRSPEAYRDLVAALCQGIQMAPGARH